MESKLENYVTILKETFPIGYQICLKNQIIYITANINNHFISNLMNPIWNRIPVNTKIILNNIMID